MSCKYFPLFILSAKNGCGPNEKHIGKIIDGRKRCAECGVWKKIDMFSAYTKSVSGLHSYCRACKNKKWTKYYTTPGNAERIGKHRRAQASTPEYKAKYNKRTRDDRRTNPKRRLNDAISLSMRRHLKKHGGNKNGWSWGNIVDYTIDDLMKHLKKQCRAPPPIFA